MAQQLGLPRHQARFAVNLIHDFLVAHAPEHGDGYLGMSDLDRLPYLMELPQFPAARLIKVLSSAEVLHLADAGAYIADWRDRFGNMRFYQSAERNRARLAARHKPKVDANTTRRRYLKIARLLAGDGAAVDAVEAEVAAPVEPVAKAPSRPEPTPPAMPVSPPPASAQPARAPVNQQRADDAPTTRRRRGVRPAEARKCAIMLENCDFDPFCLKAKNDDVGISDLPSERSDAGSVECLSPPSLEPPKGGAQAGAPLNDRLNGVSPSPHIAEGDGPPRPGRPVGSDDCLPQNLSQNVSWLRIGVKTSLAKEIAGARARGPTPPAGRAWRPDQSDPWVMAMCLDEPPGHGISRLPIMAQFAGNAWSNRWLKRREGHRAAAKRAVRTAASRTTVTCSASHVDDDDEGYWAALMGDAPPATPPKADSRTVEATAPTQRTPIPQEPQAQPAAPAPTAPPEPLPAQALSPPAAAPAEPHLSPGQFDWDDWFAKKVAEVGPEAAVKAMFAERERQDRQAEAMRPAQQAAQRAERLAKRAAERAARQAAMAEHAPAPTTGDEQPVPAQSPASPPEDAPVANTSWTEAGGGPSVPYEVILKMGEQCRLVREGQDPPPLPDSWPNNGSTL